MSPLIWLGGRYDKIAKNVWIEDFSKYNSLSFKNGNKRGNKTKNYRGYSTERTAESSSSAGWVSLCGHTISVMLFNSPNQETESLITEMGF